MTTFHFKADWTQTTHTTGPTLHISSADESATLAFYEAFLPFAKIGRFEKLMDYNPETKEIIFLPSQGRGYPGAYSSDKECLAINFLSGELRDIFMLYFPELRKAGMTPEAFAGTNAFYFHKEEKTYFDGPSQCIDYAYRTDVTPILSKALPDQTASFELTPFTKKELDEAIIKAPKSVSSAYSAAYGFFNYNPAEASDPTQPTAPSKSAFYTDSITLHSDKDTRDRLKEEEIHSDSLLPVAIAIAPSDIGENVIVPQNKLKDTISKADFEDILNTYKSQSIMGYLSTFWIFSWISTTRSQTMVELKSLLLSSSDEKVTRTQIEAAINRGDNKAHRLGLFKEELGHVKNGTGTDEVIVKLKNELNKGF